MPALKEGQRVYAAALDIEPKPARQSEILDFFGNRMIFIELAEPHDHLKMKMAARVAITPPEPLDPEATDGVGERCGIWRFGFDDLGSNSPVHFLYPSRHVTLDPEIRDYARRSFPPNRPVFAAAVDFMNRIKADFSYEIGATDVDDHAGDVVRATRVASVRTSPTS